MLRRAMCTAGGAARRRVGLKKKTPTTTPLPVVLYRTLLRFTRGEHVKDAEFCLPSTAMSEQLAPYWPPRAEVRNAREIRLALRKAFRDGASLEDPSEVSKKLDLAFLLLRELDGFEPELRKLHKARRDRMSREGVRFRVGQSVRHRVRGYRGAIIHWDRRPTVDGIGRFLQDSERGENQPFYHVIPDVQDCLTLRVDPGIGTAHYLPEDHLELLDDECERRIASGAMPLYQAFSGFNYTRKMFVPRKHLVYAYPADAKEAECEAGGVEMDAMRRELYAANAEGQVVKKWVEGIAGNLLEILRAEEATSATVSLLLRDFGKTPTVDESGNGSMRPAGWDQSLPPEEALARVLLAVIMEGGGSEGEVEAATAYYDDDDTLSHAGGAYRIIMNLVEVYSVLEQMLRQRKVALALLNGDASSNEKDEEISFSVGDVVRHKKFSYRAVVGGVDVRPKFDVRGWDGVRGLPKGADQPFYDLFPDEEDCEEVFGSPRTRMYAAQENLVLDGSPCVNNPRIKSAFPRGFDPELGRFVPSESLRFSFPAKYKKNPTFLEGESERHAVLERVFQQALDYVRSEFAAVLEDKRNFSKKSKKGGGSSGRPTKKSLSACISALLERAPSKPDAEAVEQLGHTLSLCKVLETMKNPSSSKEWFWGGVQRGMDAFRRGSNKEAIREYGQILGVVPKQEGVLYKRSVAYLVDGQWEKSLEDTRLLMDLRPSNSIALATHGQALVNLGRAEEALEFLRQSAELNPWGLGACGLQQAKNILHKTRPKRSESVGDERRV